MVLTMSNNKYWQRSRILLQGIVNIDQIMATSNSNIDHTCNSNIDHTCNSNIDYTCNSNIDHTCNSNIDYTCNSNIDHTCNSNIDHTCNTDQTMAMSDWSSWFAIGFRLTLYIRFYLSCGYKLRMAKQL